MPLIIIKNQKGTHMKEILKIENLKKYYGNEKI